MKNLLEKYNVPVPRYTSYPTVPYWNEIAPQQEEWKKLVQASFDISNEKEGISLYIHLPFCESLCTYCGCNTRITVNHQVELRYIKAVLQEWKMYRNIFNGRPRIKEMHLGGGTPTFFSPENLKKLIEGILSEADQCDHPDFGFEGHPNNTTVEHLKVLYDLGFRRMSLGIQDFDPLVQETINRIQTVAQVKKITSWARTIGYTSINYDLIYGLPFQTEGSILNTVKKVSELHPDRIAFYSYAHVPWIKPGQRKFTEKDLPEGEQKRKLYELGRDLLKQVGYYEVGMDHFALGTDSLMRALRLKKLHRNFMGYTDAHTTLLIGLGASSISDSWTGFVQNEKKVEDYYKKIDQGVFPFFKGHVLSEEDLILRKHILNIMCNKETEWNKPDMQCEALDQALTRWQQMAVDGLLKIENNKLTVLPSGKAFLRNICAALDARLWEKQPSTQLFSAAI